MAPQAQVQPQDLEASTTHNEAAPLLEAPPASNRRRALGGVAAALGLTIGACAVARPSTLARSSTTALSKKYPHRIEDATECYNYYCGKAPLGQYCPKHVPGGGFSMRSSPGAGPGYCCERAPKGYLWPTGKKWVPWTAQGMHKYGIYDQPDYDIYGQPLRRDAPDCTNPSSHKAGVRCGK